MKVACLTLSVSRQAAGMLDCVRRPAQDMQRSEKINVEILSLIDHETDRDKNAWEPLPLRLFPVRGPAKLAYAPALATCLEALAPDLAHTFGLWTDLSRVTHSWARSTRKPYLVTPQGMLDPWALNNSRWRKRLAGLLYERQHLRDAACLHATCQAEADAFRAFGLSNPICIIPNGVDLSLPPATGAGAAPWQPSVTTGKHVLLYLGRLHPKKGLENLLHAWAALRNDAPSLAKQWILVIAGWDQGGHVRELEALVSRLALDRFVHFTGPVFGDDKVAAYRNAEAFVLPSLSEGLPLVILEAWSHGLPVLMTPACNLPEGFAAGAAIAAEPCSESLAAALLRLTSASETERREMGAKGRKLVERQFTWAGAARRMAQTYRWILREGEKPAFVSP